MNPTTQYSGSIPLSFFQDTNLGWSGQQYGAQGTSSWESIAKKLGTTTQELAKANSSWLGTGGDLTGAVDLSWLTQNMAGRLQVPGATTAPLTQAQSDAYLTNQIAGQESALNAATKAAQFAPPPADAYGPWIINELGQQVANPKYTGQSVSAPGVGGTAAPVQPRLINGMTEQAYDLSTGSHNSAGYYANGNRIDGAATGYNGTQTTKISPNITVPSTIPSSVLGTNATISGVLNQASGNQQQISPSTPQGVIARLIEMLKPGTTSNDVKRLQQLIIDTGNKSDPAIAALAHAGSTGFYGQITQAAVKAWQSGQTGATVTSSTGTPSMGQNGASGGVIKDQSGVQADTTNFDFTKVNPTDPKSLISAQFAIITKLSDIRSQIADKTAEMQKQMNIVQDKTIGMSYIGGQQTALRNFFNLQLAPLQQQEAMLTSQLDGIKSLVSETKPITVGAGSDLVNPMTGQSITGDTTSGLGKLAEKQAQDTFYNLMQNYPDAGIRYDPTKNWNENLAIAQSHVSGSPKYQASMTSVVTSIDPLTGFPVTRLVDRSGNPVGSSGGTTYSAGTQTSSGTPIQGFQRITSTPAQTAPSAIQPAIKTIPGTSIQYLDQTILGTPALKTIGNNFAAANHLPVVSDSQSKDFQAAMAAFSGTSQIIKQISDNAIKVLTADTTTTRALQATKLNAQQFAPWTIQDPNISNFLTGISKLASLARAGGEVGVLTDQDINRVVAALPSFSDSPAIVKSKISQANDLYASILAGKTAATLGISSQIIKQNILDNLANSTGTSLQVDNYLSKLGY